MDETYPGCPNEGAALLLARHACGDWGDLDTYDSAANETALKVGARILSAFNLSERIWIITEADRASTTILLPDEY